MSSPPLQYKESWRQPSAKEGPTTLLSTKATAFLKTLSDSRWQFAKRNTNSLQSPLWGAMPHEPEADDSPSDDEPQPGMQPLGSASDGWNHFSFRAAAVGLLIGTLINLSNTYYGLQTGVGAQMSMVSGLLGYLTFKLSSSLTNTPLTISENVLITSIATATGCIPITASLTSIIPALEFIVSDGNGSKMYFSFAQLFLWSSGLCFFGIVFAALMRKRLVEKEKLPWPGAKAAAQMLLTLHFKVNTVKRPHRQSSYGVSDFHATDYRPNVYHSEV